MTYVLIFLGTFLSLFRPVQPANPLLGTFTNAELDDLKLHAKEMFYHGWNSYMDFAFPEDELKPLSCTGQGSDPDPTNIHRNDVLGDYSVTLVDSLDMFAILDDQQNFEKYVGYVESYVNFNVSSTVQVFETTIRGLGGLLSAHLYASVPSLGHNIDGYNGHLLALAYDLGERLLPAFETSTGIPYPRVNLRHGVVPIGDQVITETCTSGAGSLLLEFTLLSRLTGDVRFEKVAKRSFFRLWARRSDLDLVAMSIDALSGFWQSAITGIGASIDSYYEYALKQYILFGEREFFKIFDMLYTSLKSYSFDGWTFDNINFQSGMTLTSWIDALGAFFPGLQVLHGDISNAISCHLAYYKLWNTFKGIPERWRKSGREQSGGDDPISLEWYPLRPEFMESNYYLYQATRDPLFLQVGKQVMIDLNTYNRVPCGYAGYQDIRTGELADKMESFFLSETIKYLYLLFDRDNVLNTQNSNFVFSTEGHPLWYNDDVLEYASLERFGVLDSSRFLNNSENSSTVPGQTFASLLKEHFMRWKSSSLVGRPVPSSRNTTVHHHHLPMAPEPTCQVWSRPSGVSDIASMNNFYLLDSALEYDSPTWLVEELEGVVVPMELRDGFYDAYVLDSSICKVPHKHNVIDVLFEVPYGGVKSEVQLTSQEGMPLIEATSLNGVRMKLGQINQGRGGSAYQVLVFDSIKIGDGKIVVDEVGFTLDDIIQVEKDSLFVQGDHVVNIAVRS